MFWFFRIFVVTILQMSVAVSAVAFTAQEPRDNASPVLRWKTPKIQIAVSSSLTRANSNFKLDTDVDGAIRRSLETWQRVSGIEFGISNSEKQNVSPSGPSGDGVSLITIAPTAENVLLFTKNAEGASATTRVFYDGRGAITEADIVLNPYQQFSTDGTIGSFDLESTLTHEIGHLLGLEHSSVLGATMHEKYGKNGIYGLSNFNARTLSENDISAIRKIYGANQDGCCGSISGKVTNLVGKPMKLDQVWAEEIRSGKVHSQVSSSDGSFRIDGLRSGTYRVFAQNNASKTAVSAQELGEVSIESDGTAEIVKKIGRGKEVPELQFLGFNSQLSDLAVSVNSGKSYMLYLAGRNFDPKNVTVGFNSPHISVVPNTTKVQDFGEGLSVVSFEARVSPNAPRGDYSLFLETSSKARTYIVGGLTVEEFLNPWSKFSGLND